MKKTAQHSGFTLIELLIVFAVISILTTLVALNIQGVLGKVRDGKRKSDLKEIKNALNLFYNANGFYPASDDNAHAIFACGGPSFNNCTWGQQWTYNGTIYMNVLPKDPGGTATTFDYRYRYIDRDTFLLATLLENRTDPAAAISRNTCSYVLNAILGSSYTSLIGWDPTVPNQSGLYVACP